MELFFAEGEDGDEAEQADTGAEEEDEEEDEEAPSGSGEDVIMLSSDDDEPAMPTRQPARYPNLVKPMAQQSLETALVLSGTKSTLVRNINPSTKEGKTVQEICTRYC